MIPLKVQIKNFLSYGDLQTIDFEKYQLICLSGKNGHGKSALLDAITWALWGQARKISGVSKADDGLLKIGQSQMMVVLDFECNSQMYRVKREYGKTKSKPYATLDFGIFEQNSKNSEDRKLLSLSEKRIRDTQKKIEETINLTLDSFVNSAFLRQGQANEFSKKSPKDRKEIFAQILGLQQYDHIKKLASEKVKLSSIKKESMMSLQEKIVLELEKKEVIFSQIKDLQNNLKVISTQEKDINKEKLLLAQKIKKLLENQKNKQIIEFKIEQLLQKEIDHQKKLLVIREKWKEIHKKKLLITDQEVLFNTKNQLINDINKHQKVFEQRLLFKEKYLKNKESLQILEKNFYDGCSTEITKKKIVIEKLSIELQALGEGFKNLLQGQFDKNAQKKISRDEIEKYKSTLSLYAINKKELEREEKQFEKRKEHYQKYVTKGNLIKSELDNLKQKKILSQDEGNPCCPLCEQNLSSSRKKFLKTKFEKKERFFIHRFSRLSNIIKALKKVLFEQNEVIKRLKISQEKIKTREIQVKELEKQVKILQKEIETTNIQIRETKDRQKIICKELEGLNQELKEFQEKEKNDLYNNIEFKKLLQDIKIVEIEAKNLKYDSAEHKCVIEKLKIIEQQISEYEKIRQEIALQEERKKAIHEFCVVLKAIKKEKNNLYIDFEKYKSITQDQKNIEIQEEAVSQKLQISTKQKEQLLQSKGSLENQISKLEQLEKEHVKQKEAIEDLHCEIEDYKIIADATGKNGIQALLIENAIPEIEQEANSILSRLTNNQAQIFIESLRDLKKGGTKETLDIKISDSAGIRQYELFSGGEAFRIDFALRIAISKLLARRAGTALQTLIIDEGFGSQDEEGLIKIMDAIYTIQEDFSKVIIVSHLSSMKDQFPVHFFIQKGPQGSKVSVLEHG